MNMKLGWWRAANDHEFKIDIELSFGSARWRSSEIGNVSWCDDGSSFTHTSDFHLLEFIRPLEDLPPLLNSAVKAAEDRVRTLKAHHEAAQKLADDALFILDEAKRELERLEKEITP